MTVSKIKRKISSSKTTKNTPTTASLENEATIGKTKRFLKARVRKDKKFSIFSILGNILLYSSLIIVFSWVVVIQLGIDPGFAKLSYVEGAQVAFWITVWLVVTWALVHWHRAPRIHRIGKKQWANGHRFVLVLIILIGVTTTLSYAVKGSLDKDSSQIVNGCAVNETIKTALSATYSITTNIGWGTGFSFKNGYIITNYHVLADANKISVSINTKNIEINDDEIRVWKDLDLAIIKMPFATNTIDFSDTVPARVQDVYAIGFPGNLYNSGEATLTKGIISRIFTDEAVYFPKGTEIIQTDVPLNPGNSGGPLLDGCGVIGINTFVSTDVSSGIAIQDVGIGYAISSSVLKSLNYSSLK